MRNAVFRDYGKSLASVAAVAAMMIAGSAFAADKEIPVQKVESKPAPAAPAAAPAAPTAKPAAAAAPAAPAAPAAAAAPAAGAAPKAAAAAPAAGGAAPAGDAANKTAWVKLCEKAPLVKKDKDGKDVKEEKNLCLTHHERLDGNTGMVLVSAAIRQVEGQDKQSLMIMVPLGMAIPPGIRAAVYTKEQWAAVQKNEKIDEKSLKPIELKYSLCHPAGCTAETEAT
jgi:invasion protein IalB